MTTAILVAGLLMVVAIGAAIIRPTLRLPALAFAALSIPGNVDDLLPQFALDPHPIRDVMAPVATSLDLLIVLAVVLTIRERRGPGIIGTRLLAGAGVMAVIATVSVLVNLSAGVPIEAVVRGTILWWRIVAILYLGLALREDLGNGRLLGLAIVAGGVVLLGNGVYTTMTGELDRFTAKTFGRNGLAIALTVVSVVGAGAAADLWSRARAARDRWLAIAVTTVAAASLFGMSATGTRMAFLVLLGAGLAALILYPGRLGRRALPGIAVTVVLATSVLAASVAFTTAGGRTVSIVTDPDTTVDVVTNPGGSPTETEIRSRGQFWGLALQMAEMRPMTGVGPFQWNVVRYRLDPAGPVVVADAHQAYLQIAAEYGIAAMAMYLAVLLIAGTIIGRLLRSSERRTRLGWGGISVVLGAMVVPVAALTNSHVANPRTGPLEWLLIAGAVAIVIATLSRDAGASDGAPKADSSSGSNS